MAMAMAKNMHDMAGSGGDHVTCQDNLLRYNLHNSATFSSGHQMTRLGPVASMVFAWVTLWNTLASNSAT